MSAHCEDCKYYVTDMSCAGRFIGYVGNCNNPHSHVGETTADDFCKKYEPIETEQEMKNDKL